MPEHDAMQRHTFQTIDGVEARITLDPGELFLDLPVQTPRYIRVQEGDRIQEGDVRTQTRETMDSQTLSEWTIDDISVDAVTGTHVETGESREWDREWLIQHLGTGGFSVELTDFNRVSVSETTGLRPAQSDAQSGTVAPHVIVTAYGNDGQRFTQLYSATEADDWDSLRLVDQDRHVREFSEELRERFDAAVARAIELEQRYH
ncbi:hypothetical protein [Salinilacihabitans rarus]|uniref:hypothetical protein n=1 Tax=Salinilacihabitans rarus TaxID=2961596 RepID=UPI0020C92381|nr:hypothetical protein [Salinilacihabitans rarus]